MINNMRIKQQMFLNKIIFQNKTRVNMVGLLLPLIATSLAHGLGLLMRRSLCTNNLVETLATERLLQVTFKSRCSWLSEIMCSIVTVAPSGIISEIQCSWQKMTNFNTDWHCSNFRAVYVSFSPNLVRFDRNESESSQMNTF